MNQGSAIDIRKGPTTASEVLSPSTNLALSSTIQVNGESFDYASDYHLPVNERVAHEVVRHLADRKRSDIFLCVGDIFDAEQGEDRSAAISSFLTSLAQVYKVVLYTPGNHCLRSRENPWASFSMPDNVLFPRADEPLIIETERNKILLANLFYDFALINPAIIGLTPDDIFSFYQRETTDGQKLLGGKIELFASMAQKAAERITPDISMLITHTLPHPAGVTFRVPMITPDHQQLEQASGARFISEPKADEAKAVQRGITPDEFRKYWNLKSFIMGSNVLNNPAASPRDGLVCIYGHNHRTTTLDVQLDHGAAHLHCYQPYGGRDPRAWEETLLPKPENQSNPAIALPGGYRPGT